MIEITTESDLSKVDKSTKEVTLNTDLDLSDDFETIKKFTGVFNGNNHTISGLTKPFIENVTSEAEVKNVCFENLDISGKQGAGVIHKLVGTLNNITAIGDVSNMTITGGIVGFCRGGSINNSEFIGSVSTIKQIHFLYEKKDIATGGIVGKAVEADIHDCTVRGTVRSRTFAGGLAGIMEETKVNNCTSYATVISNRVAAGLVSNSKTKNTITNSSVTGVIISPRTTAGFIAGSVQKSSLVECTVNAVIQEAYTTSGFVGLLQNSTIQSCEVSCTIRSVTSLYIPSLVNSLNRNHKIEGFASENSIYDNVSTIDSCYIDVTYSGNRDIYVLSNKTKCLEVHNTLVTGDITTSKTCYISDDADITQSTEQALIVNNTKKKEPTETIHITTERELAQIDQYESVQITENITVSDSFTPIDSFEGDINGNGHKIENLKQPLINSFSGTIQDLHISNSKLLSDKSQIGLLFRKGEGELTNVTFSDCSIESTGSEVGFIGGQWSGDITNCSGEGSVKAYQKVGGFVGKVVAGKIKDCDFAGTVEGELFCGGIVGQTTGNLVKSSKFQGEVLGSVCSGGICGDGNVSNCSSTGNVTCQTFAGGIAGLSKNITDSISEGTVSGEEGIGGIVGRLQIGEGLSNCISRSKVTAKISAGGLIGQTWAGKTPSSDKITNCLVEKPVHSENMCGGLIGQNNSVIHIIDCGILTDISSSETANGVIGSDILEYSVSSKISNVILVGSVVGEKDQYPIMDEENISKYEISDVLWSIDTIKSESMGSKIDISEKEALVLLSIN